MSKTEIVLDNHLSKSDFKHFCQCEKSLWLKKNKPDLYTSLVESQSVSAASQEGFHVEDEAVLYFKSLKDAKSYSFQKDFKSPDGLYARSDVIRHNDDGTINIYEVKSSTKLKTSGTDDHITDAAFQKITAQNSGYKVDQIFIVHLNKSYLKQGQIDREALFTFANVTKTINEIDRQITDHINNALAYINRRQIDESFCSCLYKSRRHHCDCFSFFNRNVPEHSIYMLPRIKSEQIKACVEQKIFAVSKIDTTGLNHLQTRIVNSAISNQPIIEYHKLEQFIADLNYPLYFLDFEAYSSALPLIDGLHPHQPLVFQFSLHIKHSSDDTTIRHQDYLSETAVMPEALVQKLKEHIGEQGNVMSWHASYENTRLKELQSIYPQHAPFLKSLVDRSVDLEDVFKDAYIDSAFGGSTSIKKILPVLFPNDPDLDYTALNVANGTDAMNAWKSFLQSCAADTKSEIKQQMLDYCRLDTWAMVRIFEKLQAVLQQKSE